MTFKLKKTELFKALMSVLCVLAVAFAVVLLLPRGAASADEPEDYSVTWEYKASEDGEWTSFVDGITLFTYENGFDYGDWVRAKIIIGEADAEYAYNDENAMHLSFEVGNVAVDNLANAAEYTATIVGAPASIADNDKAIKFTITPAEFGLSEIDFEDYNGTGDETNRLWLLDSENGRSALGDLTMFYNPDADFVNEYGAKVETGIYYNSYTLYTGEEKSIVLNGDYRLDDKTLGDYESAIKNIEYVNSPATTTGAANAVTKITTTATITLTDNWVLANGERKITLNKDWYIVTLVNAIRPMNDDETAAVDGWEYDGEIPALSVRPEHGDVAVLMLACGEDVLSRFAVKYSGKGIDTVLQYYDVKADGNSYAADMEKPFEGDYYTAQMQKLQVGAYTLNVAVPAYVAAAGHEHWWDDSELEAAGIAYCAVSRSFSFAVNRYEVTAENVSLKEEDGKDITIKIVTDHVEYNGVDNNIPDVVVTFRGVELEYDVDYELSSASKQVGKASLKFIGKGNFNGEVLFENIYDIDRAVNSWQDLPSIMYWTYGNYDKQMNLISGTPTYLDNPNDISFKITTDMAGETPAAEALATFQLTDGIVSDEVAASLSALKVGTYYLFAAVAGNTNYKPLAQRGVAFKVFPATNSWEIMPSIVVWTEGKFQSINLPVAKSLYGNATIVIKDSDGKDVYSNVTGVNKLSSIKAGTYTLTAIVMGSNDYNGLEYSTLFIVNEKPGIPVWATVLIVLGSLLLVAVVIFILIKVGVLRILTDKLMVKIRTEAAVDATVAAIRANKKNEEAKQYVAEVKQKEEAEAKKEERKKARRARAAEQKALPVEQKIAALEEKARKAEARAEKMKARAEAIQQRADRMKETTAPEPAGEQPTEQPATEPTAEAAATETPETTTEE